jgi:hypothetical protein
MPRVVDGTCFFFYRYPCLLALFGTSTLCCCTFSLIFSDFTDSQPYVYRFSILSRHPALHAWVVIKFHKRHEATTNGEVNLLFVQDNRTPSFLGSLLISDDYMYINICQ